MFISSSRVLVDDEEEQWWNHSPQLLFSLVTVLLLEATLGKQVIILITREQNSYWVETNSQHLWILFHIPLTKMNDILFFAKLLSGPYPTPYYSDSPKIFFQTIFTSFSFNLWLMCNGIFMCSKLGTLWISKIIETLVYLWCNELEMCYTSTVFLTTACIMHKTWANVHKAWQNSCQSVAPTDW